MKNFLQEAIKKNKYYKASDVTDAINLFNEIIAEHKVYKPFAMGNLKLTSSCLIFDLPSIITCKYACKGCYALKAEMIYKSVRVKRLLNLIVINEILSNTENKNFLLNIFNDILKKYSKVFRFPIVRIHSSGDFFSKDYLNFWLEFVEKFKTIKFYTYTKQLDNDEIDEINSKYKNFNIVKSLINLDGKKYLNFGSLEEITDLKNRLLASGQEAFICNYGIKENAEACMDSCKKCLNCANILFKKH